MINRKSALLLLMALSGFGVLVSSACLVWRLWGLWKNNIPYDFAHLGGIAAGGFTIIFSLIFYRLETRREKAAMAEIRARCPFPAAQPQSPKPNADA